MAATHWPDRELVTDHSQGVQLAMISELARYWATEYDWRRCEAKLNALPHFMTEIDGLDIHFIHVRSPHENALPVIITHGWPGSVIELLAVIDPLTNPTAHGGKRRGRVRRGDPVDARLRVLRQAARDRLGPGPHRPGLDRADEAPGLHPVRGARRRLGRDRHRRDGHPGTPGTARHAHQHGRRYPARRLNGASAQRTSRAGGPPPPGLSAEESSTYEQLNFFYTKGIGYGMEMITQPQTLYGIADSPVGLAAWMINHDAASYSDIADAFAGHPAAT